MNKTLISLAAGLLLTALGTGAHAQNLITNGDFEAPVVATDSFDTFNNLGGYAATLWGSDSTSGTHKIVDVAGNQSMQFGAGDSAYSAFGTTAAGAYDLGFDFSGSGFWALYNIDTASYVTHGPLVQLSGMGHATASLTLGASSNYRLYFGSLGSGLPGLASGMTLDNVSVTQAVTPVPEPEGYAMMVAGLGVLGFIGRRRQRG
jgi:hypothetical protein